MNTYLCLAPTLLAPTVLNLLTYPLSNSFCFFGDREKRAYFNGFFSQICPQIKMRFATQEGTLQADP
jgi:hypothetical protein